MSAGRDENCVFRFMYLSIHLALYTCMDDCAKIKCVQLISDLVAQLVRAWQAIFQVMSLSPSMSHFFIPSLSRHFFFTFFLTDLDFG